MIQLRIVFSSFLQLVVVMLGGITALTATAETIAIIGTGEVAVSYTHLTLPTKA